MLACDPCLAVIGSACRFDHPTIKRLDVIGCCLEFRPTHDPGGGGKPDNRRVKQPDRMRDVCKAETRSCMAHVVRPREGACALMDGFIKTGRDC